MTVAVLSGSETTLSTGIDVCISAMSGILQNVSGLCERQQVDHALIYLDDAAAADGFAASDLSRALLHQCGIKSFTVTLQDDHKPPKAPSVYVIVAKTAAVGRSIVERFVQQGANALASLLSFRQSTDLDFLGVTQDKICVIVHESLRATRWHDERTTRFSSSDFCDEVLQQTREMARSGRSALEIQTSIYKQYGMQRALGSRSDQYSDITKYI